MTRSGGVRAECDAVCTAFSNATPPTISTALTISRPQNRERKARICWHTIFICGKPQWYGNLLKQRGLLSRQADIRRGIDASRIAFLPAVLMRWSQQYFLPWAAILTQHHGMRWAAYRRAVPVHPLAGGIRRLPPQPRFRHPALLFLTALLGSAQIVLN